MIKVTKEELERLQIRSNRVLLRPIRKSISENIDGVTANMVEKVIAKGTEFESSIWIDTTYNTGQYAPVFCEVVKVPSKLVYGDVRGSMPWEVDMELREGDRVVASYLSISNALALEPDSVDDDMLICDGQAYVYIRYESLYCAERDGEVIPLNGYVLCEPVQKKVKELGIMRVEEKSSEYLARVRYIGAPIRNYKREDLEHFSDLKCPLNVGDLVAFDRASDIPIEYDVTAEFSEGQRLFRIQRYNIQAIVVGDLIEKD